LEAVDHWEPEYQEIIRSPRPQGPEALLAAIGAIDPDGPWTMPGGDDFSVPEMMLGFLRDAVGGQDALDALHVQPLPDEPFAWDALPPDIHGRVAEVLDLVDGACDDLLDVEHRTACRRFLARVAGGDPATFRGPGQRRLLLPRPEAVGEGPHGPLRPHRTPSQRAATMLRAGGFPAPDYGGVDLGSPDFLVAAHRARLIDLRDRYQGL